MKTRTLMRRAHNAIRRHRWGLAWNNERNTYVLTAASDPTVEWEIH